MNANFKCTVEQRRQTSHETHLVLIHSTCGSSLRFELNYRRKYTNCSSSLQERNENLIKSPMWRCITNVTFCIMRRLMKS